LKILYIYPVAAEYAYPKYLDKNLNPDLFDTEIMAQTDLDVRYLTGFKALGHDCVIFYPRRNNVSIKEFTHRSGYRMIRFPVTFFEGNIGGELPLKMLKHIKKERPDVVQFIGGWDGGALFLIRFFSWVALYCWLNKIPCIPFYLIGGLKPGKKALAMRRLPVFKHIESFLRGWSFQVSAGMAFLNHIEYYRMYDPTHPEYYGIDFSKVPATLQLNTFNPALFYPVPMGEAKARVNLDPRKKYLILVSRLFKEKGLHYLVGIMPRLILKHPNIHLLVGGAFIEEAKEFEKELKKFIADNNLSSYITFLGRVEHHEGLVYYINSAEAFVLPTYMDTFAAVNIEALACEVPVVSTQRDEIPYYLKQEVGFCIEQHDNEALFQACDTILSGGFVFDRVKNAEILLKYNYKSAAIEMIDWFDKVILKYNTEKIRV
jgi:glycosyltransferase involved in cell wall biosynthesis